MGDAFDFTVTALGIASAGIGIWLAVLVTDRRKARGTRFGAAAGLGALALLAMLELTGVVTTVLALHGVPEILIAVTGVACSAIFIWTVVRWINLPADRKKRGVKMYAYGMLSLVLYLLGIGPALWVKMPG